MILQHGIYGSTQDLRNLGKALWFWHHGKLRIVLSDANENCTMDGVAAGGQRLAELVKRNRPKAGGSLSFACHALGGIYARSALAILEEEDWFARNDVIPANFVTLATPHLGVAEIETFSRYGKWFLGKAMGATGATPCDLALLTDVLAKLCEGAGLRALQRFKRRVVYGNLDDDFSVRTCSSLILPSLPSMGSKPLNDGEPREVPSPERLHPLQMMAKSISSPGSEELSSYNEEHRQTVGKMLRRLCDLSWERYLVNFPFELRTGAAHVRICNHTVEDTDNCGENVVAHICQMFLLTGDGENVKNTLTPKVLHIQDSSPPDDIDASTDASGSVVWITADRYQASAASCVSRVLSPCPNGCGHRCYRDDILSSAISFVESPTCCSSCKGPDGPHAPDCMRVSELSVTRQTSHPRQNLSALLQLQTLETFLNTRTAAVVETFSCFSLSGLSQTFGTWSDAKGKSFEEAMAWMKEHDGRHSHAVVQVCRTPVGDYAQWFHAWVPAGIWHKSALVGRAEQNYPDIKGSIDAVLNKFARIKSSKTQESWWLNCMLPRAC